jgi:Holliday junction DNA helicase RuvB
VSEERLADGADIGAEDELDRSLRPRRLDDFIGQEGVKQQLAIFLEAARQRGEALDHVLLAGPPGLGKTSLAGIVAAELDVGFHVTSGPVLERKGDLAAVLTALDPHDVLFIDEIHRLNRAVEEVLYPAMEDFQLDVVLGQGPSARTLRLDLPRFTLIGATTRTGLLTTPLRGRFGLLHRLDYYDAEELGAIVRRSARLLGVEVDEDGSAALAARSRGTPRIANRLLRRVRDVAQVRGHPRVDRAVAEEALELLDLRGPPGGPGHPRRQRRRVAGHDRGRLRAVPPAGGPAQAHAPGARRDAPRVPSSRPRPTGRDPAPGAVLARSAATSL